MIRDDDFKFKEIPIKYSIGLFVIPLIFAGITSITLKLSMTKLLVYIIAFLFLFLTTNLIDSKAKFYCLIVVLIISATIVGLYGVYQYKAGVELKESWVDKELNPDIQTRVISTFDNPNVLAEYLILTIPITFALLWNANSIFKKLLFLLSAAIQGLCILLTFSRGGWLGIFLAMLIFAIFVDRRLFLLYIAGGVGLIALSPKAIMTRISTIGNMEDSSISYRFPLWKATIDMIKDYWINGVGLGLNAFKAVYPRYMRQGIVAVHSHNIFLQMFVESGIFGIIGFIAFIFSSIRLNLITFAKGIDIKMKRISISVFASIAGIFLHGLVDNIFFSDRIVLMLWVLISLGITGYLLEFDKNLEKCNE
jgi:putative inorganic carbon (HCO3(-)) transporter